MTTIVETLRALTAYPIPMQTLVSIAEGRGLTPYDFVDVVSSDFRKATADVYMWLSNAPDVSQGGQSFSFTDEQRTRFMQMAQQMYAEAGEVRKTTIYGYKGSRL